MNSPVVREYNRKIYKKCTKCRQWKPKIDIVDEETGEIIQKHAFGRHDDNPDGLQVHCLECKGKQDTKRRNQNVRARLRHHIATRCSTQLGKSNVPPEFTKNLESYLGYRMAALVTHLRERLREDEGPTRSLRDALDEGYHIDHRRPLSTFNVVAQIDKDTTAIDWEEFRRCWAIENLVAIPAQVNLQKGATWDGNDV